MRLLRIVCTTCYVVLALAMPFATQAETRNPYFSRVNTFGGFGAFAGDSSHMFLGAAQNRRLLNIGVLYGRRLKLTERVSWQYNVEFMPVALESDPVVHTVLQQQTPTQESFVSDFRQWSACIASSTSYSETLPDGVTYSGTVTSTCSRTWTVGEAFSPVGFQWNFRPLHRLQPLMVGHGGFMYSTQPIPVDFAGSFNFTFDVGAGVEWFRSSTRSIRADYRYRHISNDSTANENPGIDAGIFQITYAFGR